MRSHRLFEFWRSMLKYIVPQIPRADLALTFGYAAIGALIAGSYGVLHDQITYTIGPEYFHNFKFDQFAYANLGMGNRVFAACVGFLATWWVGLIVGWILARRCLPNQSRVIARRQILIGFAVVFSTGILAGIIGYAYGIWRGPDADYSVWETTLLQLEVKDTWSFLRVGYIHNASYIGGFVGLVLTYFVVRPTAAEPASR